MEREHHYINVSYPSSSSLSLSPGLSSRLENDMFTRSELLPVVSTAGFYEKVGTRAMNFFGDPLEGTEDRKGLLGLLP